MGLRCFRVLVRFLIRLVHYHMTCREENGNVRMQHSNFINWEYGQVLTVNEFAFVYTVLYRSQVSPHVRSHSQASRAASRT